jgi:regulator of RNase E activity RraA
MNMKLDLAGLRGELFSAVLGDVMDAMGLYHQFLPPEIQPLDPSMVIVGYAMPVLEADCRGAEVASEGRSAAFGKMFEALDSLKPGEVYICAGGSGNYAQWGELMSTRARALEAAGAVVSGYSRDTNGILKMSFPTFSRGRYALDQGVRGRVIDYRCAIEFPNATVVEPGDLIFGDLDGVVVVPHRISDEVVEAALEKVRGENQVRSAIEGGMSTVEAFKTFGIM